MVAVDGVPMLQAARTARRFQTSQYDGQTRVAAKRTGCATLCSEDLNDGQDYDGARVVNPFGA